MNTKQAKFGLCLISAFPQEAHKMVQEANVKRAQAEKSLAESEMKVRLQSGSDNLTLAVGKLAHNL